MSPEENKAIVLQLLHEVFTKGNAAAFREFGTPNVTLTSLVIPKRSEAQMRYRSGLPRTWLHSTSSRSSTTWLLSSS